MNRKMKTRKHKAMIKPSSVFKSDHSGAEFHTNKLERVT